MSQLTPRERLAIERRVRQLTVRIQDPRLRMKQIDDLQRERLDLCLRLRGRSRHDRPAEVPQLQAC